MQWRGFGSPRNLVALTSVVFLGVAGVTLLLRLPQRIRRGGQGQQAIEMLDAVRRPFIQINKTRAGLLDPVEAQSGYSALSSGIASATELLERYQVVARYNDVLSSNVGELTQAFETWVAAERRLFGSAEITPGVGGAGRPSIGFRSDLAAATSGFALAMDILGAGEGPIHADIADGTGATRLLGILALMMLLYVTATAFLLQHTMRSRERQFLEERLRLEQDARQLERQLGEALAKVLGGFIPICASCKRIRAEDNQWTQVEAYVTTKTDAQFSHGICPKCEKQLYGDLEAES